MVKSHGHQPFSREMFSSSSILPEAETEGSLILQVLSHAEKWYLKALGASVKDYTPSIITFFQQLNLPALPW
jgi:hypothetical protein